jgi:hypothetical protein
MPESQRATGHVVDYMARDFDSLLRSMREQIPRDENGLSLWTEYESEADLGNVLLQLFAHMGDILSYYQDRVVNESFLGTAQTRRSIIHHLALIGYRLATAAPASTKLTLSFPGDCDEVVTIRRGDAFATRSTRDALSVRFEYSAEQPLVIACDELPLGTDGRKLFADVPVEEGRLVRDELLGTSDATRNQRFLLAHPQLIVRSRGQGQAVNRDIIVRTDLGGVITEWTLQESLAFSRAGQTDFVIEIDEHDRASVLFGDGDFGAIPEVGAEIRATYRVGGGALGNAAADSIQTIVDAPQLALLAVEVTNPKPATGGAERESIEHAVMHAPSVFRSRKRAVTAQDYEALALEFRGVGKVRAVAHNWNTVTLYVAPEGGGQVSDVLRADLLAYFEGLRPVSTIIEVEDVDYVEIFVSAEVGVFSYYSRDRIEEEVRRAAGRLLAFEAVVFGQPIYLSKFYEAIEAIPGVEYVNITEFRRTDQPPGSIDASGKLELADDEIPIAATTSGYAHAILVRTRGGF